MFTLWKLRGVLLFKAFDTILTPKTGSVHARACVPTWLHKYSKWISAASAG